MRWWVLAISAVGLLGLCAVEPASAEVPQAGTFVARRNCPALQSIRKATNPGGVQLRRRHAYEIIAANKPEPTHYRVIVEGASPEERWVAASCGRIDANARPSARGGATAAKGAAGLSATHLLALGWEPEFCTKHTDKAECAALKPGTFAATHLSLHGLWPQPRGTQYCSVAPDAKAADQAHNWDALPEPAMSAATLGRLAAVMPGVQSKLQRHEWIVHGTCFGGSADGYFARAAGLAEAVDASKVSSLFVDNIGKSITGESIRAAFDEAFGAGTGQRVAVSCRGRGPDRTITELRLNLAGDVAGSSGLGDLLRAAAPAPAGCPGGLVTPPAR